MAVELVPAGMLGFHRAWGWCANRPLGHARPG